MTNMKQQCMTTDLTTAKIIGDSISKINLRFINIGLEVLLLYNYGYL